MDSESQAQSSPSGIEVDTGEVKEGPAPADWDPGTCENSMQTEWESPEIVSVSLTPRAEIDCCGASPNRDK